MHAVETEHVPTTERSMPLFFFAMNRPITLGKQKAERMQDTDCLNSLTLTSSNYFSLLPIMKLHRCRTHHCIY